jgi:iron complex outermembrane receptor protein
MSNNRVNKLALMCAASVVALTSAAHAQQTAQNTESVTVTGSRIISDITLSPTPITAVTAEQLQATTPTDIPDALNKLPVFIGGRGPRSQDNASKNNGGNVLNLRNFGVQRTLILLDGHRVPASNQDGTVDVDTLPQMLMSRVDVVTGGASAVYGSDAVAGVVNFILDKKFDGFKYNVNAGISKYGDGAEEQLGIAWGTEMFGGRGHFEMAARYFNQDMIPDDHRPYGSNQNSWVQAGSGSVAAPFVNVPFGHTINLAQHGSIVCGSACPANNFTFSAPGVITPLTHGVPTTTGSLEQGGDGGYNPVGTFQNKTRTGELFGRLSYDVSDDVSAYVQASWAESGNFANWAPWTVSAAASRPSVFFSTNPYLSPAAATALGAGLAGGPQVAGYRYLQAVPTFTAATNPAGNAPPAPPLNVPVFSASGYQFGKVGGVDARAQNYIYNTQGYQRNLSLEAGLSGTIQKLVWDLYYNHAESRLQVKNPHNTDNAKYLAAQDAVIAPAGTKVNGADIGGTITCWVTTQGQFANLDIYKGCQPMNLFDPNGPSVASFNYVSTPTWWNLTQVLDNIGGTIHGGLWGLGLPAGEITAALSGEMRWSTYTMASQFLPTDFVDCTGLRMCLVNSGTASGASQTAPVRWVQNVNAPVDVNNNVYEFAVEVNVPLLKNVPMFQELSTDIAGRYTNYSTSGESYTWKVGGDWHVDENLRFRGTMSVDIRAPNLNDLFQPVGISSTGFTDNLPYFPQSNSTQLVSRGNPNLVPEVAHTYSAGIVLTPEFIPGFTASVDWYTTHMSKAISNISYQSTQVQAICNASAPLFNSPYCALAIRPFPVGSPQYFTAANYPTQVLNSPVNTAKLAMEGFDVEIDYNWDMEDLFAGWPGTVTLRHLLTYQPVNSTINLPGAFTTWTQQPKTRQTTFLSYEVGDWGLNLQNQWLSGMKKASSDNAVNGNSQNYVAPRVGSFNVLDVTIDRKFDLWGGNSDLYFTVNNIGNTRAPLWPTNASNPGLFYPVGGNLNQNYWSDMGRYFTIGIRGNL